MRYGYAGSRVPVAPSFAGGVFRRVERTFRLADTQGFGLGWDQWGDANSQIDVSSGEVV